MRIRWIIAGHMLVFRGGKRKGAKEQRADYGVA